MEIHKNLAIATPLSESPIDSLWDIISWALRVNTISKQNIKDITSVQINACCVVGHFPSLLSSVLGSLLKKVTQHKSLSQQGHSHDLSLSGTQS